MGRRETSRELRGAEARPMAGSLHLRSSMTTRQHLSLFALVLTFAGTAVVLWSRHLTALARKLAPVRQVVSRRIVDRDPRDDEGMHPEGAGDAVIR